MSSIQHNSIEADAIVSALREQVAALTKEKDELVDYSDRIADSKHEELAASQAREAKLREGVLNTANACRIWGGEAERARKMLEHYLAITDSTQSE